MTPSQVFAVLKIWLLVAPWLPIIAGVGFGWLLLRRILIRCVPPAYWLANCRSPWPRLVLRPYSGKWPWLLGAVGAVGLLVRFILRQAPCVQACFRHPHLLLLVHAVLLVIAGLLLALWDNHPHYVLRGEGRADGHFRKLSEDWDRFDYQDGKRIGSGQPVAALLGYRAPQKPAQRALLPYQRLSRNLALIFLRWDLLCRHLFLIGQQGSGKTTAFFGQIMHSASCPWIYQDGKADLPHRDRFSDRPIFGLDLRGHISRSGVLNFLEEIRTSEDFDLIVDYVLPINPRDANPWVREMSRVLFGAILRSRRWESLQELSRTVRSMRLEPFLQNLDPIWKDLLKEPKSQVPVLQDLVAMLSRWENPRVSAITEGQSTVTLDDFITRGGWVMNCEMSDALRAPVHLLWAMLMGRLRNRPDGAPPLLLLLDEFGDCGRLPNIERALVLLRSKGVSFIAGIQNLGLLKDVYPQNWQAVAQGFGTKIWLLRNAEEETRETLTRVLGKWTRRLKAANAKSRDSERETDLVPVDAWGRWSDERAVIARANGFTYWLPLSLHIETTPAGAPLGPEDPWAEPQIPTPIDEISSEALDASEISEAAVPPLSIPGLELLQGLNPLPAPPLPRSGPLPDIASEEDWL